MVLPSQQVDSGRTFLNNEMIGIEMGTAISNLSKTIDIQYNVTDKVE